MVPPEESNAAPADAAAPAAAHGTPAESGGEDAETRAPMYVKSTLWVVCLFYFVVG